MKQLIILTALFMCACSMPHKFTNVNPAPEDIGWNCKYSEIVLKNKTKVNALLSIDGVEYQLTPKQKKKHRVTKGNHNICINDICEKISLYPCISYDFTPTLFN